MPAPAEGLGRSRQSAVYREGIHGRRPVVPTDFAELERRARRACSAEAWAYVAGGAGEGRTMTKNLQAFERRSIVPRMAGGNTERDLGVDLLGRHLPAPVLLAPVGALALVDDESDVKIARAAARHGLPYLFSNQGCQSMEECAAAMDGVAEGSPRWFQLYWSTDEDLVDSFIARAEAVDAEVTLGVAARHARHDGAT
ncbi:MAG: lactate 2-monooxygenase, partial [Actinomycetales bacterium]